VEWASIAIDFVANRSFLDAVSAQNQVRAQQADATGVPAVSQRIDFQSNWQGVHAGLSGLAIEIVATRLQTSGLTISYYTLALVEESSKTMHVNLVSVHWLSE
jgi:hypothetical protein